MTDVSDKSIAGLGLMGPGLVKTHPMTGGALPTLARQLSALGEGGGPIEKTIEQKLLPQLERPRPFPIKARNIDVVIFTNTLLVDSVDEETGETVLGLTAEVQEWLDEGEEKDILDWDWKVNQAPDGTPLFFFLMLYAE